MNLFTRIVCLGLMITALLLLAFRSDAHSQQSPVRTSLLERAKSISGDDFRFDTKTRSGARVLSADRVSSRLLDAIDKGLDELFEVARNQKRGYAKRLRHSDYIIFVGRADRKKNAKGEYSPDIAVGSAQYAGTKYDKGGYIYAAGIVISLGSNAFMIADHTSDFERVSRVVRYEGEHLVLYHNDRKRYRETMDHSRGGGHPILQ